MFRTTRNIILLLILCFIATGVPLYADTIDINFPAISQPSTGKLQLVGEINQVTSQEWKINATLSAEGKTKARLDSTNPLTAEVYFNNELIRTVDLDADLLSVLQNEVTESAPLQFELVLDQKKLNLPDGHYEVALKAHVNSLEEPLAPYHTSIEFNTQGTYLPALRSINRNETALTLYFPDQEGTYLIPVTRVIPYTTRPLRTTLDELEAGPAAELGLKAGSPIPGVSRIGLNRRIASVYLPQDIGVYDQNASDAAMALGSFVNSLAAIPEVDAVQFYFNNRIVETGFHGTAVDQPHYPEKGPMIYDVFYTETGRILLSPRPYQGTNASVEALLEAMKYSSNTNLYGFNHQPSVPESLELVNYQLINGTLTLYVNETLFHAFQGNADRQAAMVEALVYTLSTLEAVDRVAIQAEGGQFNELGGLDISNPLKPSPYINPEK